MKKINIKKLNEINRLQNYRSRFYNALQLFYSISGKLLKEGEGRVMIIYNSRLKLYEEGLSYIEELQKSDNEKEISKIIEISDIYIKKAEQFKKIELCC